MRASIELPDHLAEEIRAYLHRHKDMSLDMLVARAIEREIAEPDPEALRAMVTL
jgi:hypothetical protein